MKKFGNVTPNLVHKGLIRTTPPETLGSCFYVNAFLLTTMKADSFGSNNETVPSTGRLRKRKIGISAFICEMNVASGPDDFIVFLLENHPEKSVIALVKSV